MNIAKDILSLTDFKRRSSELLKRMKRNRRPMVLTVNGKAELVVQTADQYQRILDELERNSVIEGIRRGMESMNAGRGRPAEEVFAEMEERYPHLRQP
jgi:prevent-host-death family protein